RLQRGLLLRVEQPGQQPPVEHLAAVVVGVGRVVRDGRPARVVVAVLGHVRSSFPARSRRTATAVVAAFSARTPALSAVPPAQAPACRATGFLRTSFSTASGCTRNSPPSQRSSAMQVPDPATASGVSGPASGAR